MSVVPPEGWGGVGAEAAGVVGGACAGAVAGAIAAKVVECKREITSVNEMGKTKRECFIILGKLRFERVWCFLGGNT